MANETLLITGGTGSFGQKMAKIALEKKLFDKIIIFSRDEWKQWEMKNSDAIFSSPDIRFFIGDVRDSERLERAFKDVDVVIHAAALKQIVTAEYNPTECVRTNVIGAMNVQEAAIKAGVKKVVALSTDKSVNPVNLYGATKLCQDKLIVAANNYVGHEKKPLFSVVRYGNVASTRGSVIPYWEQLIKEGVQELPVTDDRMTRFWITLEEAVHSVLQALNTMRGGEIFVPKIPSFHIKDLLLALKPDAIVKVVGIRPGEKLHEVLISLDESRHTLEFKDHYTIFPEFSFRDDLPNFERVLLENKGSQLKEGFIYSSGDNDHWLTIEDLRKAIQESHI